MFSDAHRTHNIHGSDAMSNQQLSITDEQTDQGVIILKTAKKWLKQSESCKTPYRVQGFIVRNFKYQKQGNSPPTIQIT